MANLLFRYIVLINGIIGIYTISYGQTNTELLKYGTEAFYAKNYSTAAFFYGQYVNKALNGSPEIVYPYEFLPWNPKNKEIAPDSFGQNNSINPDSLNVEGEKGWDNNFQDALYLLAQSYYLSYNYLKAEETLKLCKEGLDSELYPHSQYWYGRILIGNMKYKEAQIELEEYIKRSSLLENPDSLASIYLTNARKLLNNSKWAEAIVSIPLSGVKIQKADSTINGPGSHFSASFYNNDKSIIFSSAKVEEKEDNNVYNLYVSNLTWKSIDWEKKIKFSNMVNSNQHEGTPYISKDGSMLFFTRWGKDKDPKECSIYLSRFFNNLRLPPQKLGDAVNMPGHKSMHPFLSEDGSILYFASNRPGGKGKMDIWYCEIDEYGKVGSPINLGGKINTTEDDVSPYYSDSSQTLFFSSKGHRGMGGFDIFQSYGTFENYHQPENLGFPINSGRDELHLALNNNENYGFLTSDRDICVDCKNNSACYSIFEVDYNPPKFTLSGRVFGLLNSKPIANSLITFNDKIGYIEPFFIITDENGYYHSPLRRETTYNIKAQKVKYFADAKTVTTVGLEKSTDIVHDFYLPLIPVGEIEIKGIFYDYDQWELRPESKITLDSLVYFLNINNNIIIELSSHTDSRGTDDYNMNLSQQRAQSVVDYLKFKGIPSGRLKPIGYGESKPRIPDAPSEDEPQLNRRTAFKVIGEDFVQLKNITD